MSRVSPAVNLAAPSVSFDAGNRVLILGAEHHLRIAANAFGPDARLTCLLTESMPESLDRIMDLAAELAEQQSSLQLLRLPLKSVAGYLGRFQAQVELNGQLANLAELVTDAKYFDAVLDFGRVPQLDLELTPAGYIAAVAVADVGEIEAAVARVTELRGQFEKPRYVQVNSDLCAHSNSGLTGCTRCLDVCPADAISLTRGKVGVDAHLCHGAGGCTSVCPTSALDYSYPQPQLLLDRTRALVDAFLSAGGTTPVVLIHDAEQGQSWLDGNLEQLPGHWLPLQVEELGAAGMDHWLASLAWGAAGVVLLDHPEMPEKLRETLINELETVNRILAGMGYDHRVSLQTADALSLDAAAPEVSWPGYTLAADGDKRQRISLATAHLFRHSKTGGPGQQASIPTRVELARGAAFGSVTIEESGCTLCMSCVSICPTKALSSGGDLPSLSFKEDACVQCGLCQQACPERVVELQPGYQLDPQLRQTPRVLKQEEPFCCIRCDKPFATQGMVNMMLKRLAGHSMFEGEALNRLKMCQDCRVVDLMLNDSEGDLYQHARGQQPLPGNLDPIVVEPPDAKPASPDPSQNKSRDLSSAGGQRKTQQLNGMDSKSESLAIDLGSAVTGQQGGET